MNRPPHDLYAEFEDRLRFEMLLTELSARFASVTSESLDREIVDAQRRIVQALGLDRSTLGQLKDERFVITHAWNLPGLEPFPDFAIEDLPWLSSVIKRGEVVRYARIDDLPPRAAREKEVARRFGPRSNITFPLKVGGEVIGGMGFGTVFREREWPEGIVNRLQIFVDMIGSAIARTRAERALLENEEKLRLILDSTAEAIFGIDLEGRCTFCNPACLRLLGYERVDELLGREMHPVIHYARGDGTPLAASECRILGIMRMRAGIHVDDEVLWRANGTSFPVEYWCYPQWRRGEIVGAVVAFFDITQRKLTEAALASVSGKLIEAQEQERSRIARELHDDIGQRLALLAIELAQLQQSLNSIELPSRIGALQMQTLQIATDTQSLSHELHSSRLQYLSVGSAMRGFCQEFSKQQNVEIDCEIQDLPMPLSPDISLCFFRVLQEALNNATKHSGARHFEVRFWATPDEVHLTVSDPGSGFDVQAARAGRGLGLVSMEERLRILRGTLSIESRLEHGTTIHARVPLRSNISVTPTVD